MLYMFSSVALKFPQNNVLDMPILAEQYRKNPGVFLGFSPPMTNLCKLCECGHSNNKITPLPMGTIELYLNFVVIILISFNFTSSFSFAGKTIAGYNT